MRGMIARILGRGDGPSWAQEGRDAFLRNVTAERIEPQLQLPAVVDQVPAVMDADKAPKPLTEWTQAEWLSLWGNSPAGASGVVVTPETAMRHSAVAACARIITGAIGSLPIHVYKRGKDNSRERADNHPLDWILNGQPNAAMTPIVWLQYLVNSILFHGDAFCLIGRTGAGVLVDLVPVNPKAVSVAYREGMLFYAIQGEDGAWFAVDQGDILHIPGDGFDGRRGKSVIGWAGRNAIGGALAAEEYAQRFFVNGARPDVVLKYPNKLTAEQANQLREYWVRKHSGLSNAHTPAVLTEGGDIETLSLNAVDAQLLESRKWSVIDIARAFGVPPFLIGETEKTSSWGSGIETMGLGFINYTLMPYLVKIQQEINRKLLQSARFFCEFVPDALLRGDAAARGAYYRQAIGGSTGPGWMRANEIRQRENLPPDDAPESNQLFRPATTAASKPESTDDEAANPPAEPAPAE